MVKLIVGIIAVATVMLGSGVWFVTNPVWLSSTDPVAAPSAEPDRLRSDVEVLAASNPSRAFHNVAALNRAADHITDEFGKVGCEPERQTFRVKGDAFHNILCSWGPLDAPRLIIGAHYDVADDDNPGADDNASGVAALLELARMIEQTKPVLSRRVDLVAFSLEEPPNFRSNRMGSVVFARKLADQGVAVDLMISVEMIGYFSDEPGSQNYPVDGLDLLYPDRGNFIAIVGDAFERWAVARVKALMGAGNTLPVYSINAPASLPGIDFSDHLSFWNRGFPALMVTDTSFYRNPNYHTPDDLPETLDYHRMAKVVDGLYQVLAQY